MVLHLATMVGYKPPAGLWMTSVRRLADGTYEVTLEPPPRGNN